jgi:hypothetical protein
MQGSCGEIPHGDTFKDRVLDETPKFIQKKREHSKQAEDDWVE